MPAKRKLLSYRIAQKAQKDIERARLWYDNQQWNLGLDFVSRLEKCFTIIRKAPHHYMHVSESVQRAHLKQYPYKIFLL